ncbi:hypothetical protein ES319_A03G103100v1 [Gossypium barbadense]|uniref:Uncharacterized protein n=1 Tax=Gossypium barbadense TaxID=3634 RepID=A0A5J5WBN9_GOSBA|nr:hypothetical protein ES319_A03G103100v1 [Gossypium barbadense]
MLKLSQIDSHSLLSFNSGKGKNRYTAKQAYECLSDVASSFPQLMLSSPPSQSLLFCLQSYNFHNLQTLPHFPSTTSRKKGCCLIVYSPSCKAITSTRMKKCDLFLADVNTQLKSRNVTTDIKVDTISNVYQLFTTITVNEPTPRLKAIFGFRVVDQRSSNVQNFVSYEYVGISSSIGLTANLIVNFSGVLGTNVLALRIDTSFDTKIGNFTKCNAGLSFTNADLIACLALHVVMNKKGDSVNASYYHIVNPSTNIVVGAEVTHSFSTNVNTITVGTQHALDPLTTIKAQANNAGKASVLIQHEWRPKSFFTISREVDTESIDKSPNVGLALALKP